MNFAHTLWNPWWFKLPAVVRETPRQSIYSPLSLVSISVEPTGGEAEGGSAGNTGGSVGGGSGPPSRPAPPPTTKAASPATVLVCTFGKRGVLERQVPEDGLCDSVFYMHIYYDSRRDKIKPLYGLTAYKVLANAAKAYNTTTFGASMFTDLIAEVMINMEPKLEKAMEELFNEGFKDLGMLDVDIGTRGYDDVKANELQYFKRTLSGDLLKEVAKNITDGRRHLLLSIAMYANAYRVKNESNLNDTRNNKQSLIMDYRAVCNCSVALCERFMDPMDPSTEYSVNHIRNVTLVYLDDKRQIEDKAKDRMEALSQKGTGIAAYNIEMDDFDGTCGQAFDRLRAIKAQVVKYG
nr:uncharacterized protein LOC129385626 isoform X3 [Dermacentor andersoni]